MMVGTSIAKIYHSALFRGICFAVLAVLPGVHVSAQSRLIYPRVSFDAGTITGLAVVNPGDSAAAITFTAYGVDGTPVEAEGFQNPSVRQVGGGEQLSEIASTLFGSNLPGQDIAWVEATSSASGLTGFFLVLNPAVSFFDGADLPVPAERFVFPEVRTRDEFRTELNIVNPSDAPAEAEVSLVEAGGRVARSISIAARGVARFQLDDLFAAAEPVGTMAPPSYVVVSSNRELAGFSLAGGAGDALGLNAQPADTVLNQLYFPQLAVLDPFITEVTLVNLGEDAALVTLTAHREDGELFGPQDLQANPVVRVIEAGDLLKEDLETLFGFSGQDTLAGWLEVESSEQAIQGTISYSIPTFQSIAAVSTGADGVRRAVFSHIATTLGFFTGVAMLNPGTLAANVEVVAVAPDGDVIGSFSTTLRPGQRVSRLITELIAESDGRGGGLIWVSSDVPIYLTSLFGSLSSGVLANIPPQAVLDSYRPEAEPSIMIDPALAVLSPGGIQQFSVAGGRAGRNWSVNGVVGGSAQLGTIDQAGRFSAPVNIPMGLPVTVTAAAENQLSGASVDIVSQNALVSGLGIIQSVAYLEGLDRLFAAELLLSPGTADRGATSPAQNETTLVEDVSSGQAVSVASFADDISKLLAFVGVDGREYLLLAGRSSGTIRRLDPESSEAVEIASGLNAPNAMVIDPFSGVLLVAESDDVATIPADLLNGGLVSDGQGSRLLPVRGASLRNGPLGLGDLAPTGIAVDGCTGNLLIADAATQSILLYDRSTGVRSTLVEGLSQPGQLTGLFRVGVSCPSAFHLFIIENGADRVRLSVPSAGRLVPWANIEGVRDLTLLSEGTRLQESGGIVSGSATGTISFTPTPGLYEAIVANPPVIDQPAPCAGTINFPDANLESAVRTALRLDPEEPISCADATDLRLLIASSRAISSLTGIESLTGLTDLLIRGNQIRDLRPLRGLVHLEQLDVGVNLISDLSGLDSLSALTEIRLSDNQLASVSALRRLTALQDVNVARNEITDISALSGLTQLTNLDIQDNQITDIGPLVANPGLGPGDVVAMARNSLDSGSCEDIQALIDRGVTVFHDVACP